MGRPRIYAEDDAVKIQIQVRKNSKARFDSAKDEVSKSFGFTLNNAQFMEYMLNKVEEDIKSKGAKNPYEP
jgi:hypothetical protein